MKQVLQKIILNLVNAFGISSKIIGTPKKNISVKEWCFNNSHITGVKYQIIYQAQRLQELPPITTDGFIPKLFSDEYERVQDEVFVAVIPNGRVWGRCGAVITPDDNLMYDVSREFGRYGGVFGKSHSINNKIKLTKVRFLKGNAAVLSAAGCSNYHHWLYDVLPRIQMLKLANFFDQIDYFIIDYSALNFQRESLEALGVSKNKIIICNDNWKFHVEAESLYVPALAGSLGRINGWVIEFLRNTFLSSVENNIEKKLKIYLSRKKAPSRKLLNEASVFEELSNRGYQEFFAEDFSIKQTAKIFATCTHIIGVHGSGFSNLAFCTPKTKVIDIVAPYHYDGYYWMISNKNNLKYALLFGSGDFPKYGADLVKHKVDNDIEIDIIALLGLNDTLDKNLC